MNKKKVILLLLILTSVCLININALAAGCLLSDTSPTMKFLKDILSIIRWTVPVIIIIMSSIDFAKAVTAGDDKGINTATKRSLLRLFIGVLIFIIPELLNLILRIADSSVCGL